MVFRILFAQLLYLEHAVADSWGLLNFPEPLQCVVIKPVVNKSILYLSEFFYTEVVVATILSKDNKFKPVVDTVKQNL